MSTLSKIFLNSAGIDIGSEKVFVSVEDQQVKVFRTFTASYRELAAYLKEHGIIHVAMKRLGSTGSHFMMFWRKPDLM